MFTAQAQRHVLWWQFLPPLSSLASKYRRSARYAASMVTLSWPPPAIAASFSASHATGNVVDGYKPAEEPEAGRLFAGG